MTWTPLILSGMMPGVTMRDEEVQDHVQQPAGRQSCAEEGGQVPCSRWSLIRTNFEEATAASMGK